jgi:hypothetical protein
MTFCARKNALYVCWTSTRVRTIGLIEGNRCKNINKNMIISHENNVMPNALTSGAVVCIYYLWTVVSLGRTYVLAELPFAGVHQW